MSVDKIVLRAVLSTLAAIVALLIFMLSALCIAFPSTMMGLTYRLGLEGASIHFAERAYKDTEDIYFLSYATEVAIEEEDAEKILSLGVQFIKNDGFDAFCGKKGEQGDAYGRFIYSQVCIAKYGAGEKQAAIDLAYEGLKGEFAANNPLVALLLTATDAKDVATVQAVLEKLNSLAVSAEEQDYWQEAKAYAEAFVG